MKNVENLQKMIKISKKLNPSEYEFIKQYVQKDFSQSQMRKLDINYSSRNMNVDTKDVKNNSSISEIYANEITKITTILNNENLLKNIGGLKILFHGKTGTGKTSLVNEITSINKNYEFISKTLEEIISPKMGQTQINLLTLAKNLNMEYKSKKAIIFIDEIDSIINSRTNVNDVAEHGRIVSTFIKFLDLLNTNIVLFAATNIITSIDDAVQRRFNIKVKGNCFSLDSFFNLYKQEGGLISSQSINKIQSIIIDNSFSISELNEFINAVKIDNIVSDKSDVKLTFIKLFPSKISIDKRKWSKRDIDTMRRGGINVNS